MLKRWLSSEVWIFTLVIFGSGLFLFAGMYGVEPKDEIRVEVNGLPITEGEIIQRMAELKAPAAALRGLAEHSLVQDRLIDLEVSHRQLTRAEVWSFLGLVRPSLVQAVRERYLAILESRAVILKRRDARVSANVEPDLAP